jgi:hypothetical protein
MRLVSNIQTQIEATRQQAPGPSGLNVWITGDVSHLQMENYRGFPDDPSTPTGLATGISGRFPGGVELAGTQESWPGREGQLKALEFSDPAKRHTRRSHRVVLYDRGQKLDF